MTDMISILGGKIKTYSVSEILEKIKHYSLKNRITIAILNADFVLGKEHLLSAAEHALRAFEKKRNLSKHLETEILLYASGERQINEAIDKIGIKGTSEKVALVVIGKANIPKMLSALNIERNDSVLERDIEKKLSRFGFTESEIKSVNKPEDLILEKIALLVEKIS